MKHKDCFHLYMSRQCCEIKKCFKFLVKFWLNLSSFCRAGYVAVGLTAKASAALKLPDTIITTRLIVKIVV